MTYRLLRVEAETYQPGNKITGIPNVAWHNGQGNGLCVWVSATGDMNNAASITREEIRFFKPAILCWGTVPWICSSTTFSWRMLIRSMPIGDARRWARGGYSIFDKILGLLYSIINFDLMVDLLSVFNHVQGRNHYMMPE